LIPNMSSNMKKYIGLDVHKEATSIAVLNGVGKLVMESIIETKAATLLEFGVRVGIGRKTGVSQSDNYGNRTDSVSL
jgi:hypothetical protein